jgi:hypothetical protein
MNYNILCIFTFWNAKHSKSSTFVNIFKTLILCFILIVCMCISLLGNLFNKK